MVKTVKKEYQVYDYNDLKNNDELFNKCYYNWLSNPDNINDWSDENIDSFKTFTDQLGMKIDFSLSNAEYPDRSCYIKLDNTNYYYIATNDRVKRISEYIKDYKGNGYYICDNLKTYTDKLINQWNKDYSINDFSKDIENKMFDLWFEDNQNYFSKENFSQLVECNEYEFYENGDIA